MKNELSDLTSAIEGTQLESGKTGGDLNTRMAWLRTKLAVERTTMAWNRTSLSLIGFGFTIYEFLKKVQEATSDSPVMRAESPRNFGLAFVVVGTLGTLVALWQYYLFARYLRSPQFRDIAIKEGMPHSSLPLVVTVFLAIIGLVTTGWVALSS